MPVGSTRKAEQELGLAVLILAQFSCAPAGYHRHELEQQQMPAHAAGWGRRCMPSSVAGILQSMLPMAQRYIVMMRSQSAASALQILL